MNSRKTRPTITALLASSLAIFMGAALLAAPAAVADTDPESPIPDTSDSLSVPELLESAYALNGPTVSEASPAPYGTDFPVVMEANFARPHYDVGTANADFALLDDLERLIRGSYLTPTGQLKPKAQRSATVVNVSVSRMEKSVRVGREMIKAAQNGVTVRFIHGKATQSAESRSLAKKLAAQKTGHVVICSKGKSLACMSSLNGAIAHAKIVMVSDTYTRDGDRARGAVWTGSSNYGGRSGEYTYNNGITVYNDKKMWVQMSRLWNDMWARRNINNDYLSYVSARSSSYGYAGATSEGYSSNFANRGMFYSNLSNYTIYATPIKATPTNGRDPVLNMLNRVVPDNQCRIRLMENRFKYRRIAVAYKLVELSKGGCRISAVGFKDDNKKNYQEHCQIVIRICRPILDVFKTSVTEIDTAYAHPHDKTILVDAKLKLNKLNPEERTPDGHMWPQSGHRATLVLAGSAALTGSNLVMSDEVTTETTDPEIYDQYLNHWKAITTTRPYGIFRY